jgi:hypothetical protein
MEILEGFGEMSKESDSAPTECDDCKMLASLSSSQRRWLRELGHKLRDPRYPTRDEIQ